MLSLKNLHLTYDHTPILCGIDLDVAQGEVLCLLGKSGSGKTTILRIIAGLEAHYDGDVLLDGISIGTMPPHQRGFGLMFQDFALFPHMSVAQNVTFGLRMQNEAPAYQQDRLHDLLKLVGLAQYAERNITQLSGGEQQRVALARSLAPKPKLLMLDEPLGALDAGLRQRLVVDLRNIIKQIGVTAIYVTHDQEEAYIISDRIAVMNAGRIEQIDAPQQLYYQPKSEFVARFLGLTNIVKRETLLAWKLPAQSDTAKYLVHPVGISLHENSNIEGVLKQVRFKGDRYDVQVQIDETILSFGVSSTNQFARGDKVKIIISPDTLVPLSNPALPD